MGQITTLHLSGVLSDDVSRKENYDGVVRAISINLPNLISFLEVASMQMLFIAICQQRRLEVVHG